MPLRTNCIILLSDQGPSFAEASEDKAWAWGIGHGAQEHGAWGFGSPPGRGQGWVFEGTVHRA